MNELMRYRQALQGIASCSTECLCCEMHKRVARSAVICGELTRTDSCPRKDLTDMERLSAPCEACGI